MCVQGEYLLNDCMMSLDLWTGARKTPGAQNGDPSRCGGFLDPRVCVCLGGGGGVTNASCFSIPAIEYAGPTDCLYLLYSSISVSVNKSR